MSVGPIRRVSARRHPDQVLVAGFLAASGLSVLAGGPRPGSVSATLPLPLVYVWAGVLVLGGVLTVAAALVPSPEIGLYLELVAHPPTAVMLWVYAASAAVMAGPPATVAVGVLGAIGLARTVRTVQVIRTLRALHRQMREGT